MALVTRIARVLQIRTPYSVKFGKDLIQELKKKLSGDFEDTVVGLMETPTKFDAMQLRKAMKVWI